MKKEPRSITPPTKPNAEGTEAQDTEQEQAAPAQEAAPTEQPAAEQRQAEPANPNLVGKFAIVGMEPGLVHTPTRHRTVDLRTITAEVAEELVASGRCQYLVRIEPEPEV